MGAWSPVAIRAGQSVQKGGLLRPLPSKSAVVRALGNFDFKSFSGVSDGADLPEGLREAVNALGKWAGVSFEQGLGRILIRLHYDQCLALPSELGGMTHHTRWESAAFPFLGSPAPPGDPRHGFPPGRPGALN